MKNTVGKRITTLLSIAAMMLVVASCVKVEKECTFPNWRWPGEEGGTARQPMTISNQYLTLADLAGQYTGLVHGDTVKINAYLCTDTLSKLLFLSDSKELRYRYTAPDFFLSYNHLPLIYMRSGNGESWRSAIRITDLADSVARHADTAKCYIRGCLDFDDMGGCVESMNLFITLDQITINP